MNKAYIQTFGCQMNVHDSQRMTAILEREGYTLTEIPEEAQLIIFNTCSVRQGPENKVYSSIGRLNYLKELNNDIIIGVTGCVAQQEGERILKRNKCVDLVLGPDNIFKLPEVLKKIKNGARMVETNWRHKATNRIQDYIPDEDLCSGLVENGRAYISITKGCDNFCTFCIVPYTRGRLVSRSAERILQEGRDLIKRGAKELMLLGQNVNSYQADNYGFYELLRDVADLDGLSRLRFTSPHPNDWNNALSDLLTNHSVICNYLHLPFQSGSNSILEQMNRQHTQEGYVEKLDYLKSINEHITLSTDVIVGFPGETNDEFEETLNVLEHVKFLQVYSFKYSSRPGTKADGLVDDVPEEIKKERLERVHIVQARILEEHLSTLVGTVQWVLVECADPKTRYAMLGRTESNFQVTIVDSDAEQGDLIPVTITRKRAHSLVGAATTALVPEDSALHYA